MHLVEMGSSLGLGSSSKPWLDFRLEVNKTKAQANFPKLDRAFFLAKFQVKYEKFGIFSYNLFVLNKAQMHI